jgi:hypothetical protein
VIQQLLDAAPEDKENFTAMMMDPTTPFNALHGPASAAPRTSLWSATISVTERTPRHDS